MAKKRYWLKMVGAADWEVEDRWVERESQLLTAVRFPRQPSGIGADDRLVYYSAGSQKLFAIARATMAGEQAPHELAPNEERWPYVLRVQVLVAIPTLALAPHWSALGMAPGTVQQKSHVELTDAQYAKAVDAIVDRVRN